MFEDQYPLMISAERIKRRLISDFFDKPILDNNLRGYWCEAMVAETLGGDCAITSGSWAPWDLQIGADGETFPDRIRIQVKNSARRQSWHRADSKPSDCEFNLTYRALASDWMRDFPDRQSESAGFHCDIFALCLHDTFDPARADQRDPTQWQVFLLAAHPRHGDITEREYSRCKAACAKSGRPVTLQRRPQSMLSGIRGRRPTKVVPLPDLTLQHIRTVLDV